LADQMDFLAANLPKTSRLLEGSSWVSQEGGVVVSAFPKLNHYEFF
jgi:hypothetical protein